MIITTLTLVPLVIGLVEGISTGVSAVGDVIFVVVTVALSGAWLGIVLWGIAIIRYRRTTR